MLVGREESRQLHGYDSNGRLRREVVDLVTPVQIACAFHKLGYLGPRSKNTIAYVYRLHFEELTQVGVESSAELKLPVGRSETGIGMNLVRNFPRIADPSITFPEG